MRHSALRQAAAHHALRVGFTLNKFYMTKFRGGDETYIYPTEETKSGKQKGLEVFRPAGRRPEKAKKKWLSGYHGFNEVAWSELDSAVQDRFKDAGVKG